MNKMSLIIFYILITIIFNIMFILLINSFNMISMIILIMIYSLMIFSIMPLWSKNFIYSIIMFLTLISGLLIIFLYFTSLISNMKNTLNLNSWFMLTFLMNMFMMIMCMNHYYIYFIYNNKYHYLLNLTNTYSFNYSLMSMNFYINMQNMFITLNEKNFSNIINIYLTPYNHITLLCIFFLLMSMFSIIKMCSIKYSSLRKIH